MKPRSAPGKLYRAARFYPDESEDAYMIGLWQPSKPPDRYKDDWVALFDLAEWNLMGGPWPDKGRNVLVMISARELKQ